MRMGLRLDNAFGGANHDLTMDISTQWAAFERIDKLATERIRAEIVQTLTAAGATLEGAARVAGYTDEATEALMYTDMVDGIGQ